MLKVKTANWKAVNGTSLKGYVYADFATLEEVFGAAGEGDGYKVDAEWCLQFSNGVVATIYNYKDGKNYCGDCGLDVEDITEWHVGGHSAKALASVEKMLAEHYAKQRNAETLSEMAVV